MDFTQIAAYHVLFWKLFKSMLIDSSSEGIQIRISRGEGKERG